MPVAADLARMLQPVERRLVLERILGPVERCHQCRIEPQCFVVNQALVAEPEAEDPLAQQIGDTVRDGYGRCDDP